MVDKKRVSLPLSNDQGKLLVQLARQTLLGRMGRPSDQQEMQSLETGLKDECFSKNRGTFVCLKIDGQLRGCIGNLNGGLSIVDGIRNHAVGAAFHDSRFAPLDLEELALIRIEVSVLTDPLPLIYRDAADLVARLRPGVDGVVVRQGSAGATFLPQVWEQLPDPENFLSHLCMKAGLPPNYWQHSPLETMTYQVQHFAED